MKKSRFNEAQIIVLLREQEAGSPTAEVCRVRQRNRARIALLCPVHGAELRFVCGGLSMW